MYEDKLINHNDIIIFTKDVYGIQYIVYTPLQSSQPIGARIYIL